MAELHNNFLFTGGLGKMSAYRMKGSDKIILRTKGGPTKRQVKEDPNFEPQRRNNMEFAGRSLATKYIRSALFPLYQLADYRITGSLNSLLIPIQAMDTANERGKRNVYISRKPKLLEGFNLNQRNPFDSIVRNPLVYELNKENATARINIPALMPGINFFVPPGKHPWYSFVAVLGLIPDLVLNTKWYESTIDALPLSKAAHSDWHAVTNGSPDTVLDVSVPFTHLIPEGSSYSAMLSIGIRFGTPGMNEDVKQVSHAGAAKILAMG